MKLKWTKTTFLNLVGLVLGIYLAVLLAQTVKQNYELKKQIDKLQVQITDLNSQKDELSYQIQYYKTEAFQEKEARAKFGLQQPGESVIILPKSPPAQTDQNKTAPKRHKSNPAQWWDFLFG